MIIQLELRNSQNYVRVIMTQLLHLRLPISDEWYVIFRDATDLNFVSYATRKCKPSQN
jgi:hypothetical protein